jgi:hypothetical protein
MSAFNSILPTHAEIGDFAASLQRAAARPAGSLPAPPHASRITHHVLQHTDDLLMGIRDMLDEKDYDRAAALHRELGRQIHLLDLEARTDEAGVVRRH